MQKINPTKQSQPTPGSRPSAKVALLIQVAFKVERNSTVGSCLNGPFHITGTFCTSVPVKTLDNLFVSIPSCFA